jgi:hypothetical protein
MEKLFMISIIIMVIAVTILVVGFSIWAGLILYNDILTTKEEIKERKKCNS